MRRVALGVLAVLALLVSMMGPVSAAPAPAPSLPLPTLGFPPDGANDWSCQPTRKRPTPVIIVHGTFGDQKSLLDPLSRAMVDRGLCVYALDYGNRGTGPIAASARQLKRFVAKVRRSTGAAKVSMVGHSQGGMMPRHYIKFLGGKRVVDDLVGIAPSNHGTAISGGGSALQALTDPLLGVFCVACTQQVAGSPFLKKLNAGDETPGKVSYTQITTQYDEVVVPHTSGYLRPGPRTTNVTIQDSCAADFAEHLLIPMSRTAIAWTLNALTRRGAADPGFRPAC
ncbi:esterase/lipase family protein [Nocardioides pacificus]